MNVVSSSLLMKSTPNDTSSLETECLFGETVEILDENLDWVYCKLKTDNYHGWIKKTGISKLVLKTTHRVIVKRSFIYKEKSPKSNCLLYLPMGSKLKAIDIKSHWTQIEFYFDNQIKTGFVPTNHIVSLDHKVKDWVSIAQQLEGTPYKWGGRDTIGIDCSALLQLSYQTYGKIIPRNTSQQVLLNKPKLNKLNNLKRGCVIFWKGHVGIMVDNLYCIHANAFHMKTVIEPLDQILNRMDEYRNTIKMMDFN